MYADENDIHSSLGVSSVAGVGGTYYESAIHALTQGIEKSYTYFVKDTTPTMV